MEWLLDTFEAQTTKIWLFEAARALGTTAAAKAPRGSGGLPKQKCVLQVPQSHNIEGLPMTPESTIGEEWSSSPLPSVPV